MSNYTDAVESLDQLNKTLNDPAKLALLGGNVGETTIACTALAQSYATLALVEATEKVAEEARTANLISLFQTLIAPFDPANEAPNLQALMAQIHARLGLS